MIIHISDCIASRKHSQLIVRLEQGKIPPEVVVKGRKRIVRFVPVPYEHELYDEDQWDGEQAVFIPTTESGWVKSLVVSFGM